MSTSSVNELLTVAYGSEELGRTGHHLAGHEVVGAEDVASVVETGQGSSLLYGELLPDGVSQLMEAFFVNRPDACRAGSLLELGMGTGKVALQLFLSLPGCSVFGVELAPSRWALADAALRRLAEAVPERFRHEPVAEHRARLLDLSNGEEPRVFDIVCGSLLDTPIDILAGASAVVMEVCLPKEVQRQACRVLQHCQVGCRVVCYAPLHGMVEPCRLAPVRLPPGATDTSALLGDGQGGLALAASWKPHGHGFAFYELAETADAAAESWEQSGAEEGARIVVDTTGCPSRGRRMKYTD
ncbi:unnamed protein product, partial [Polarella glacialis]